MTSRQSGEDARDAISLLRADHANVLDLFEQFRDIRHELDEQEKDALVARICGELIVHTAVEEEMLYPEARAALGEDDLFDEATVEHAAAKDLIAQLGEMEPGDDLYDAKVSVLGEYVKHHIQEEQDRIFPRLREAAVDLDALGERLAQRKAELMDEIGLADLDALMPREITARASGEVRPS